MSFSHIFGVPGDTNYQLSSNNITFHAQTCDVTNQGAAPYPHARMMAPSPKRIRAYVVINAGPAADARLTHAER